MSVHREAAAVPAAPADASAPGREDLVEQAVGLLSRGACVCLVGRRTSGRSTTLRAVGARLQAAGRPVVHVRPGLGAPPLHALRAALPPGLRSRTDGAPGYAELEEAYGQLLESGTHVLVVDDAELLDVASRGLVASLHEWFGTPVVQAHRPQGVPDAEGLPVLVPGAQLRLDGLRFEALLGALQRGSREPVDPLALARVHRDSAGLPGLAVALLDGAEDARDREAVPPVADGGYEAYLAGTPAQARDALDLLAAAGTVPLDVAGRLLSWDRLDELLGLDLARVSTHVAGEVVAVHPPGLSAHLRQPRFAARRCRAAAALESLDLPGGPAPTAAVGLRALGRSGHEACGTEPDFADETVDAVLAGTWDADVHRASEDWRRDPTAARAAPLLRLLLSGPPEPGAVEAVLAGTDEAADREPFAVVELRYLRARWRVLQGGSCREAARELAALRADGAPLGGAVRALEQALLIEFGTVDDDPEPVLAPLLAAEGLDAATARVVLAAWCVVRGRHERAAGLLDVGRDGWPTLLRDSAAYLHALALFGAGDHEGALAASRRLFAAAVATRDRAAYVTARFVAALTYASMGEMEPARVQAFHVLRSDARAGGVLLSPDRSLRVLAAATALVRRETTAAPHLLGLVDDGVAGCAALPYGDEDWTLAMELQANGNLGGAAEVLDGIAGRSRARGHDFAADVTQLAGLVVSYDPRRAAAFARTVAPAPGTLHETHLAGWRALHEDRDPEALLAVGRRLQDLGARQQAARAYVNAMALFRAAGRAAEAVAAREAAHALQGPGEPLGAPVAGGRWELSARERQLLALVARGMTNAEIADELSLSVRTVESHVRNVRRKTGVSDRAELAGALRG